MSYADAAIVGIAVFVCLSVLVCVVYAAWRAFPHGKGGNDD